MEKENHNEESSHTDEKNFRFRILLWRTLLQGYILFELPWPKSAGKLFLNQFLLPHGIFVETRVKKTGKISFIEIDKTSILPQNSKALGFQSFFAAET